MSFSSTIEPIIMRNDEEAITTHEGSIFGVNIPNDILFKSYYPINEKYRDPCFYPTGIIASAQIKDTDITVELFCDGETRAHYFPTPGDESIELRDYTDFLSFFPDGDKQLHNTHITHIIDWSMNPWFDLYQPSTSNLFVEHLDNVNHDIVEAVESLIQEVCLWKPYLYLLDPDCPEEVLIQAVLSQNAKSRETALMNRNKPDVVFIADALNP
jgi:hypothetical protein